MIDAPSHLAGFYLPWIVAVAASAAEPAAQAGSLTVGFDGLQIPVLQAVLAVAGVLMARPLAPKREGETGWVKRLLVTIIMLVVALAWVVEARPGILFTFTVSIGLGFSGYALIELAGTEIEAFVKRIFARAAEMLPGIGKDSK